MSENTPRNRSERETALAEKAAATDIQAYLDRLCARVKAKELHPELREEMRGHIEELMAGKMDQGAPPDEAAEWALAQMGDADEVGGTLGRVHRPRLNWLLFVPLAVMIAIGMTAIFSLDASPDSQMIYSMIAGSQAFYYGLGAAVLIACRLFDYRLFKKYAVVLYAFTVLFTMFAMTYASVRINGNLGWINIGGVSLNWPLCMFVLLLIALPGVFERLRLRGRSRYHYRQIGAVVLLVIPAALHLHFHMLGWLLMLLYLAAGLLIYIRAGGTRLYAFAVPAGAAAFMTAIYLRSDYWQMKFRAVLAPGTGEAQESYVNNAMSAAIREAGWWGHGFGSRNRALPYAHAESIFPYVTYSFGWIVAGVLAAAIIGLTVVLFRTLLAIREHYGRSLAIGLSVLLAGQLLYGLGASFSLLPFTTLLMPFIGSGGSSTLVHCAIVGLILGVYRRKDMLPYAPRAAAKEAGGLEDRAAVSGTGRVGGQR
ncbi:FtsW/RodA/SpoVE family cell cycle protein [Saccharibacillus sp. CPCC 101409]|uniref:FtsW/RodA/SpoVE family cell cycle protein n=1 Tax=Saccharibacillus sp. CPCC 101409 TaxID=3058041 RepID=UPI002671190F|nr:FtsW/RodA/SpoVE family cell cycle protein [Saccharibacillus sp. CPCC 101409]MDO3411267.1 FtsW/RodA/SpoVE family cell cycle protein [Saccharibacillus sp. CPCC 101409]